MMTIEERDKYIATVIKEKIVAKGNCKIWSEEDKLIRDEAIYHEMGKGKSTAQIAYELTERWECKVQTVYRYIKEAKQRLIQINKENPEAFRNKMMEKIERVARKAEEAGDRKSMLAAYDMLNKLNGAYTQVQKVEADVKSDIKFEFGGE